MRLLKLLIASHNPGKINEFHKLFEGYPLEIMSLLDFPEIEEVEETGTTFEENARLKAETIAQELQCIAIADDSGLVVPALNDAPGVYSARYSGEPKDDQRNNTKLLAELLNVPDSDRHAKFVSCIVAAYPQSESLVVTGHVDGQILREARGEDGFGYDPLFYYPPAQATFAQMSLTQKNAISHRGQAVKKLMEQFEAWMGGLPK